MNLMPDTPAPYAVIFGGWYQRTTLHLTEVYDFLAFGRSHPELDQSRLKSLHDSLNLASISRQAGYLEFVQAKTSEGIVIRYYEDGLYVLELDAPDIKSAAGLLQDYYQNTFEPAISYIFSLGAPIPKILANIKTVHPIVVWAPTAHPDQLAVDPNEFGPVYSRVSSKGVAVYKTPQYIFIATAAQTKVPVFDLMEMQIFFREFKDQLDKYLQIHRKIWEEISDIKERQIVRGKDIGPLRSRLDRYQKTINLIGNRINQMGTYIHTRTTIAKDLNIETHLKTLFEYKFEVLSNTLAYIKEIWSMTRDYLTSAIQILTEIESQTTTKSIKTLQVVTSTGIISGILLNLAKTDFPRLTWPGLAYFALLILLTLVLNLGIAHFYKIVRYRLKFTDSASDI